VRLWVNDKLIINHWTPQDTKEWSGTIGLLGGTKYKIKMEYFDKDTIALAQLRWKSDNIPLSLIPTQQLYATISTQDAIWTGKIWNDRNYNGVIDAGENPIPDAFVSLYNVLDEFVNNTYTDLDGIYTFNIPPTGGIYHLRFSGGGQGFYENTTGLIYGTESNYNQLYGGDTITLNAGFAVPEARAEFLIYYDENEDLIPDFDDQVLKDVKVYLMQGTNKIDSLLTDSTGYCTFKKIIPGSYFFQVANSDSTLYPVFGLMPDYTTPLFTLPPGTAIYKQLVFFKKPVVGTLEIADAAKVNWRIFPNPPEDHLNIAIEENNAPRSILISLVDVQGKFLYQFALTTNLGQNNLTIPVQHLPEGLYHMVLESAGNTSVRRFLKE
jgi:hypothetical protein